MIADKKVAFYTLGCKLNFSETSTIARNFVNEGFERVDFTEEADIYVINTCSVTDNADKRFKSIVKNALKKNDEAFMIAVGCYAQLKPEELAAVDGVDLVLGATEKFNVTSYINDLSKNKVGEVHSCEIIDADFYVGSYSIGDRTRAFLKVQDGCDYKCTYCTIPLARGISRSDTLGNVIKNAAEISEKGIKEIVLTGVHVGGYGSDLGQDLYQLVVAILEQTQVPRIRFASVEPWDLPDNFFALFKNFWEGSIAMTFRPLLASAEASLPEPHPTSKTIPLSGKRLLQLLCTWSKDK